MSAEQTSRFNVCVEDLRKHPWQDLIAQHPEKDCIYYREVFGNASNQCRESGDDHGERVYAFLNAIASFFPNFGSEISPYRAMLQMADGRRSMIPDDLTDQDLDALAGILLEIEDAEYRARVADTLWICRKDFKAAQLAVTSFLESANTLKTDDLWSPYMERIDRAAVIASKRGFESARQAVIDYVEKAILEFETQPKSGLLCGRLMGVLLLLCAGDVTRYIALSEGLAKNFAATGEWHFAESYWELAQSWHRRAGDEVAIQRAMQEAAECLILRAEEGLAETPPKLSYAAHWMGKGLEGLRRARVCQDRIKDIHRRFLSLQKQALVELHPFELQPEEMPGYTESREAVQEAAVKFVKDLKFEDAVSRLAFIGDPTDLNQLIENEKKNADGSIWDKLFGASQLDRDGKVADIMPAMGSVDEDPDRTAFRKKLVQTAKMFGWPLAVEWRIEPARQQIAMEHSIRLLDLNFLVTNNAFIPQGHEGIYRRGIQAGFFGDWIVAMHLLIPQLEASFRHVLQQHGVVTSTLKQGIQQERDINDLLWDSTAEKVFGDDLLFDLRGILIERFGSNMRNDLAHGLMYEGEFRTAEAVYLWWLVIRMCWIGYKAVPEVLPEDA